MWLLTRTNSEWKTTWPLARYMHEEWRCEYPYQLRCGVCTCVVCVYVVCLCWTQPQITVDIRMCTLYYVPYAPTEPQLIYFTIHQIPFRISINPLQRKCLSLASSKALLPVLRLKWEGRAGTVGWSLQRMQRCSKVGSLCRTSLMRHRPSCRLWLTDLR